MLIRHIWQLRQIWRAALTVYLPFVRYSSIFSTYNQTLRLAVAAFLLWSGSCNLFLCEPGSWSDFLQKADRVAELSRKQIVL